MGNTIGGKDRKFAKVMKINGDTLKFKTPIEAGEILKDHPGLVLLESESVKHYGVRAKPLEPHQRLEPKRLYFLVELPKKEPEVAPRRVQSGITMTAKDRLESLMLARRSASDLSILPKPVGPSGHGEGAGPGSEAGQGSGVRVRVRLPKGEVERLVRESKDEAEAAEKIMRLYLNDNKNNNTNNGDDREKNDDCKNGDGDDDSGRDGSHGRTKEGLKKREKRVSFMAATAREGGMQITVAS